MHPPRNDKYFSFTWTVRYLKRTLKKWRSYWNVQFISALRSSSYIMRELDLDKGGCEFIVVSRWLAQWNLQDIFEEYSSASSWILGLPWAWFEALALYVTWREWSKVQTWYFTRALRSLYWDYDSYMFNRYNRPYFSPLVAPSVAKTNILASSQAYSISNDEAKVISRNCWRNLHQTSLNLMTLS